MLLAIGLKGVGNLLSSTLKLVVGLFHRINISRYKELIPDTNEDLKRWMLVSAAARLEDDTAPEREALIAAVRERLRRLRI